MYSKALCDTFCAKVLANVYDEQNSQDVCYLLLIITQNQKYFQALQLYY